MHVLRHTPPREPAVVTLREGLPRGGGDERQGGEDEGGMRAMKVGVWTYFPPKNTTLNTWAGRRAVCGVWCAVGAVALTCPQASMWKGRLAFLGTASCTSAVCARIFGDMVLS